MTIYNIHHTDKSKATINIDETDINQTATDLTLFGRRNLQYGQELNQNITFLLENFACPENSSNPGNPDLTIAVSNTTYNVEPLRNPTDGQFWYNSTQQRLFYWYAAGNTWNPIGMLDDVASNWGIIFNGQQIPRPISQQTGYVFEYSECSWIVSPYQFPQQINYMLCDTDSQANVNCLYTASGSSTLIPAFATYEIVGIRGNINQGSQAPIPSATATPQLTVTPTPSPTTGITPTPSPTPTAASYSGALSAYFAPRFNFDAPFYAGPGTALPYYAGDFHRIKYPGITTTKYKILYSATAPSALQTVPLAPSNPWDNVGGNYYIYIKNTPESGGTLPGFSSLPALYQSTVFCSGKSTEPSSLMVAGTDGIFYNIQKITAYSGYTQLQLSVTPLNTNLDVALFNHPPLQSSPLDILTFNYDYVYATGIDYVTNQYISGDPETPFYLTPPSNIQGSFDLYITGGTPPYTITDIIYYGPIGNSTITSNSNKIPCITASGFGPTGNQTLPAPVNFTDLINTSNSAKPLFLGNVSYPNANNANIQQTTNGFVIRNYITTDMYYSTNYATKYGTHCYPEGLWYFGGYAPSYSGGYGACTNLMGNASDFRADSFAVVIKDANNTSLTAQLGYGGNFQCVDYALMSQYFNFGINVSGPSSGSVITSAGTYTYTLNLQLGMTGTSIRPASSPAQLQYIFSLLSSANPNAPGGFLYTSSQTLLSRPTNGNCPSVSGTSTLIHTGCDISNSNPDLQCPSSGGYLGGYTQGKLIPGTSHQTITITQVWNNATNSAVNISSSPITVTLGVLNSPNTFNWTNLLANRTGQHSGAFVTPYVPNNMFVSIQIPAGLSFPGTLNIPLYACAYDNPNGGCALGTSAAPKTITLNFNNTA